MGELGGNMPSQAVNLYHKSQRALHTGSELRNIERKPVAQDGGFGL